MSVKVFISYAHHDRVLHDELTAHLSNLRRQELITDWYDGNIMPGTEWKQQIFEHFATAEIILLLVSADFMASDFCYSIEMKQAIARHDSNQARVIPIILRPVDWKGAPFAKLQMLPRDGKPMTKWADRDEAWFEVIEGIRGAIQELGLLRTRSSQVGQEQVWNVPYARNPMFTGREELLMRMRERLRLAGQSQVISGLSGIGKTQVALEYAYRHRDEYQHVLWAHADTREELISSFVAIAGLLDLPERSKKEQNIAVEALKSWLVRQAGWLLILDNIDEPALIREFIPTTYKGHILLTTQAWAMGGLAQSIHIKAMTLEEGVLFLLRRAAVIGPSEGLEEPTKEERVMAEKIVQEVGGLPLALDQTGAYIEETRCSLSEYLQIYHTRQAELLQRRGKLLTDHPDPVATTWSLAFERIERMSAAAADLLRLCAFLHPDTIPEEIITKGAARLGPALGSVAADFLAWNRACETAEAYSLLSRDAKSKTLTMHRLVQAVFRDKMDELMKRTWAERAIKIVNLAFSYKDMDMKRWPQCERLLPQTLECAKLSEQWRFTFDEVPHLLNKTATYLMNRARYAEAESLFVQALRFYEQVPETESTQVAQTFRHLALLYEEQGKFSEAEALFLRALEIFRLSLGADHPSARGVELNLEGLRERRMEGEQ